MNLRNLQSISKNFQVIPMKSHLELTNVKRTRPEKPTLIDTVLYFNDFDFSKHKINL